MNDRRRLREGERVDERHSPAPRQDRFESPATDSILSLQARAGNRAVQALLETHAAHPGLRALQREPADVAPAGERADDRKTTAVGTMTIPDFELAVPILSFHREINRPVQEKLATGEVFVSLSIDHLDPRMHKAIAEGKEFATITVALGKATVTLHSVVIASLQTGFDTATVSLNFKSMDFSTGG